MLTSYFFVNFASAIPATSFAHRSIKFNMAAAESALMLAPSALFVSRATRSATNQPAYAAPVAFTKLAPLHLGFFFKKMSVISKLLKRRAYIAQQGKFARALLFVTLQVLANSLAPVIPLQPLARTLPLGLSSKALMSAAAYWAPLARVALNPAKSPKRFLFFYFSTFMYCPHQLMQGGNTFQRS